MMNDDNYFEKPELPDSGSHDPGSLEPGPKEDATELMLVSYLDGEMDPDERREFESRLASEPSLRRRLEQLRQAWDLLDELESCEPSKRFAETTLEMVALDAETHLKGEREKQRRSLRRRRNRIGLGLLGALVTGFLLIWFLYPSPDAVLIKNLPLIAKLDQYESAESVAFLEALAQAKLFTDPAPKMVSDATSRGSGTDPQTSQVPDGTSLDQAPPIPESAKLRREWVECLEPVQKAQLLQHWERFEQLPPDRREKLFDLQHELANSKQSELLTTVMRQYSEWLGRQPSFTRTSLLDLSAQDRIAKLRSLRREELDRQGLQKWLQANHEKLRARFTDIARSHEGRRGPQRGRFPSSVMPPETRGPYPGMEVGPGGPNAPDGPIGPGGPDGPDGPAGPELIDSSALLLKILPSEDLADLKRYLSPETAKEWEIKSLNLQRLWVRQMIHRMMWEQGMERRISAQANNVTDEELADFFENHLTEEQKTKLLSTSGEQFHKNLIELYLKDPSRRGRLEGPPSEHRGRGRGLGLGLGPGPNRDGQRHGRDSQSGNSGDK